MSRKITTDEIVAVIQEIGEPCTRDEIAARTSVTRQAIANRADDLEQDPRVESTNAGRSVVHYPTDLMDKTMLDNVEVWLREVHGHRLCLTQQYLNEGKVREAAIAQGEANGYFHALRILQHVKDGEEPSHDSEYVNLSEAKERVEKSVSDGQDRPLRGLE